MGDGVLVYFGYPQAHEDDAERAVRAGLELIEAVRELKTHAGSLQTRVGIATGLVVVGDLIGIGRGAGAGGRRRDAEPRGAAAGRCRAEHASSSPRARASCSATSSSLQDLGPQDLKGFAEPVRAWAALRRERRWRAGSRRCTRARLTARRARRGDRPAAAPLGSRRRVGEGQVVLISGEPGIGKSRITAAHAGAARAASRTPACAISARPHHQDSALYPIITQLERAAGFRREDTAEQRLDKLEAVLAQATNDLRRGRAAARGSAVDPDRRPLSDARPHPAEAQGEDACRRWWRSSRGWPRVSRC